MKTYETILSYLTQLNKDPDTTKGMYGYFEPCQILFTQTDRGTQTNTVWFQGLSDLEVKEQLEEAFGFTPPIEEALIIAPIKTFVIHALPVAAETTEN